MRTFLTGKKTKENCTYLVFNFIYLKINLAKLYIGIDNSCAEFNLYGKYNNLLVSVGCYAIKVLVIL